MDFELQERYFKILVFFHVLNNFLKISLKEIFSLTFYILLQQSYSNSLTFHPKYEKKLPEFWNYEPVDDESLVYVIFQEPTKRIFERWRVIQLICVFDWKQARYYYYYFYRIANLNFQIYRNVFQMTLLI